MKWSLNINWLSSILIFGDRLNLILMLPLGFSNILSISIFCSVLCLNDTITLPISQFFGRVTWSHVIVNIWPI